MDGDYLDWYIPDWHPYQGSVDEFATTAVIDQRYSNVARRHAIRNEGKEIECLKCGWSLQNLSVSCNSDLCVWKVPHGPSGCSSTAGNAVRLAIRSAHASVVRKQRERESEGYHRRSDFEWIFLAQLGRCYYCGQECDRSLAVKDHVESLSRGGSQWPDNIVSACKPCNDLKNTRSERVFMKLIEKSIDPVWKGVRPEFIRHQRAFRRQLTRLRKIDNKK